MKFIRFGQWRIEQTGQGILAFITNHGYLDNPTFRGMRQQLMKTFDEIYVLDLHGNAKKKEVCPDGTKDQNVFDIQQGVAIGIFVKTGFKQTGDGVSGGADTLVRARADRSVCPTESGSSAGMTGSEGPGGADTPVRALSKRADKSVRPTKYPGLQGTVTSDLQIRRRDLPHWQQGGSVYFVTFRSARGDLPPEARHPVISSALHDHGKKYDVIFGVVMPDHVHLLLRPMETSPGVWHDLHMILKSVKGVSARQINQLRGTTGTVWQDESFDRIVRDEKEFQEKFNYMLNNPIRAGLAERPEDYEFYISPSSAGGEEEPGGADTPVRARADKSVRPTEEGTPAAAKVHHADLWGVRETVKYPWLFEHDIQSTEWTQVDPQPPFYLFTPQNTDLLSEYQRGWKIREAMPVSSVGIVTGQDAKTIAFSRGEAENLARDLSIPISSVAEILYRPFDRRFLVYDGTVVTRPRAEVMRHMLAGMNLGFLLPRRVETVGDWQHTAVTRQIPEHVVVSLKAIDSLLPLYLYPGAQIETSHRSLWKDGRRPNFAPTFIDDLSARLNMTFVPDGRGNLGGADTPVRAWADKSVRPTKESKEAIFGAATFGPEDVFHYIYAVLHSPVFRTRYAQFLKIDFPCVPLTSDQNLFRILCAKGEELVALHLLESPALDQPIARYPVPGPDLVEKGHPKYLPPGETEPGTGKRLQAGRVYISKGEQKNVAEGQYFDGVPPEVWEFRVGGYQVCDKWLKDRAGRTLTYDERLAYQRIVTALKETIRVMAEIDATIPKWPLE